jgi:hypothetical protein
MNWDALDVMMAATLVMSAAGGFLVVSRFSTGPSYLAATALAGFGALALVWTSLAVGLIGEPDNPANLVFAGVLALGAVGALLARFRPMGLALTLAAMGAAQAAVTLLALSLGLGGEDNGGTAYAALFAGLWLCAAWLYREAARTAPDPS